VERGELPFSFLATFSAAPYPWLRSPEATCRLNSTDRPRGTLTDLHSFPAKCLARSMICPT